MESSDQKIVAVGSQHNRAPMVLQLVVICNFLKILTE